jgi:hypothetical protein
MRWVTERAPSGRPEPRRLLLAALRAGGDPVARDAIQGAPLDAWEATLALAKRHGVLPLLARSLLRSGGEPGVPGSVRVRLEQGWRASGVRNALLLAHLGEVLRRFDDASVPVIVLKGADLAERVYEDVSLRPMSDVDLLVRPDRIGAAVGVLDALGFAPEDARGPHPSRQVAPIAENLHVAPMTRRGGIRVEIHYAIATAAEAGSIDHEGIWSRAAQALIGGVPAPVMTPEDLLLHLCIHVAVHHGFEARLVQVCDIPAVVDRWSDRIDWAVLWSRARAWGVERSVDATFSLAERLLAWTPPAEAQVGRASPPAGPAVAELCERLLFQESPSEMGSPNFVRLMGSGSVIERAALALARAFPSRREMAFLYGLSPGSLAVFPRYPMRAAELVGRYAGRAARVLRKDQAVVSSLDVEGHRARLVAWLRRDDSTSGKPDTGPVLG